MKQTTKNWLGVAALVFGSSAVTSAVIKRTEPAPQPVQASQASPAASVAVPGGLVDLTSAAESAVNSVVYIKVTQAGKTQRVQVQDPSATSSVTSSALEAVSHSSASTRLPTVMQPAAALSSAPMATS